MSSTHAEAIACLTSADPATFASLPLPLARLVFLALPPDARGRASCVCRAWRDVLAEPSLWTRLDMSIASGFYWDRGWAVLRGALGRAPGQLRDLVVPEYDRGQHLLLPVLRANAGSLRELHLFVVCALDDSQNEAFSETIWFSQEFPIVEDIEAAAPLLQVLTAKEVCCTMGNAVRMLRAEPPFATLQLRGELIVQVGLVGFMEGFNPFISALADITLLPSLLRLCVLHADTAQPDVTTALVDAALARRLRELRLDKCTPPAAAPLARLLASNGSLKVLKFCGWDDNNTPPLFDATGAALVADALRVNTTLTELHMVCKDLCRDMRAAVAVLGALVGHVSLRKFTVAGDNPTEENSSTFGDALAAIIAADAPVLRVLNLSGNLLLDAGLAPIMEALTHNHHLCELDVSDNEVSEAFERERLLPAVRANTSLRKFRCAYPISDPAAAEAEELVRRRGHHG
jgi:hypothetical protein